MKLLLVFCLLVVAQNHAFGQKKPVSVQGILKNDQNEILSDISVTLWENTDSVTSVKSNIRGQFAIQTIFDYSNSYMLTFDYRYQSESDVILFQPSDSVIMNEFIVEIELIKNVSQGLTSNSEFYFPKNKTNEVEGLDIEFIKVLIETYPNICLEIAYKGSNEEKKELGKKRIKFIRELLIKNDVPLTYFQFKDDQLKIRQYEKDQRARFWLSVISLEGC